MIWQHCIAVAPRTSETTEHGDFDFTIRRSDRPRYTLLDYNIQKNVVNITGISIQNLEIILADKDGEELDSGMREEFGRVVGGQFQPQGANGDASRYHCFSERFVI
jgi:hypothetical protein